MRACAWLTVFVAISLGCSNTPSTPQKRVTLRRVGGTSFELIPNPETLPYCLAYTVSKRGLTRQLTMSKKNLSFECKPGRPIGGISYRVPLDEGPVKIHVVLTSQQVNAAAVTQDILDAENRLALSVMNMRLPGVAAVETIDFDPSQDVEAQIGGVVELDGGIEPTQASPQQHSPDAATPVDSSRDAAIP